MFSSLGQRPGWIRFDEKVEVEKSRWTVPFRPKLCLNFILTSRGKNSLSFSLSQKSQYIAALVATVYNCCKPNSGYLQQPPLDSTYVLQDDV